MKQLSMTTNRRNLKRSGKVHIINGCCICDADGDADDFDDGYDQSLFLCRHGLDVLRYAFKIAFYELECFIPSRNIEYKKGNNK